MIKEGPSIEGHEKVTWAVQYIRSLGPTLTHMKALGHVLGC